MGPQNQKERNPNLPPINYPNQKPSIPNHQRTKKGYRYAFSKTISFLMMYDKLFINFFPFNLYKILHQFHFPFCVQLVRKILNFVKDSKLTRSKLFSLRGLSKSWREVVDNEYLPYFQTPASFWTPYIDERIPEDILARSKDKSFKTLQDLRQLVEMSKVPKQRNPFPTREVKMWCNGNYIGDRENIIYSFDTFGQYIWSFTYVLGPMPDSLRFVYSILQHLHCLEDLRIINMNSLVKQNIYFNDNGNKKLPELPRCPSLVSISLTRCMEPSILDDLLGKYGKQLEELEVEGPAFQQSRQIKNSTVILNKLKKLKITLINATILDLCRSSWPLTHVSFVRRDDLCASSTSFHQPVATVSLMRIMGLLENYRQTLLEVHLHLNFFDRPGTPLYDFSMRSYRRLTKLGLPFQYAKQWNNWNGSGTFPKIEYLEFHDWSRHGSERPKECNKLPISQNEKLDIQETLESIWKYSRKLKQITVLFTKSEDKVVYKDTRKKRKRRTSRR